MIHTYSSADAGAPTLAGQAGSLIALLEALFEVGYNFQAPTSLETSGTPTATVYCPGHGFREGQIVAHTGADQAEYNVTKPVHIVDVDYYEMVLDSTPVDWIATTSSAFAAQVAPVNWPAAYTGTNEKTWTDLFAQVYLAVDDTDATDARVRGFTSVTSAGVSEVVGTDPFPLDTDVSGGLYVMKSSTADATARDWRAYSDQGYFHLLIKVDSTQWVRFGFGAFPSFQPGDGYAFGIEAAEAAGDSVDPAGFKLGATVPGFYVMRNSDQTTPAGNCGRRSYTHAGGTKLGSTGFAFPAVNRGGLLLDRVMVIDPDATADFRGYIPGLWNPLHDRPFTDQDTVAGATAGIFVNRAFDYFETDAASALVEYSIGVAGVDWTTAAVP